MSDARSLVDEMRVSQAEHLPLVAAFPERMVRISAELTTGIGRS